VTTVVVKFQHSECVRVGGVIEPVWRFGDINSFRLIARRIIVYELKRTVAGGRGLM
jgi:hypothetical protein